MGKGHPPPALRPSPFRPVTILSTTANAPARPSITFIAPRTASELADWTSDQVDCTALGLAAWVRYTSGVSLDDRRHEVSDPLASRFIELHERHGDDPEALVAAFLAQQDIVPAALAAQQGFADAVTDGYRRLINTGLAASLSTL